MHYELVEIKKVLVERIITFSSLISLALKSQTFSTNSIIWQTLLNQKKSEWNVDYLHLIKIKYQKLKTKTKNNEKYNINFTTTRFMKVIHLMGKGTPKYCMNFFFHCILIS